MSSTRWSGPPACSWTIPAELPNGPQLWLFPPPDKPEGCTWGAPELLGYWERQGMWPFTADTEAEWRDKQQRALLLFERFGDLFPGTDLTGQAAALLSPVGVGAP